MHSGCASTSRIFSPRILSPWHSRRRIDAKNGLREQVVCFACESWGPRIRGHLDHPRVPFFFFISLAFSLLSLVFMLRTSVFSRAHEEEEYTSVRELFAKRTEEPGRRFAGDVVPPRVRFPDGHAPRSALSEGGCRRHRRRCCCCCCCCYCSRRCIHHREVIATGGVAEDHFPSCSLPLLLVVLSFAFHRRLRRFNHHRIKYLCMNTR